MMKNRNDEFKPRPHLKSREESLDPYNANDLDIIEKSFIKINRIIRVAEKDIF